MNIEYSELLRRFERLEIQAGHFSHRDHVQVAFEMLHKYPYLEACTRYAGTISEFATNAGVPRKFNVTITFAFLSLIAERIHEKPGWPGFDEFIARNEDLLSKGALQTWYTDEELHSEFARTHFLLPKKVA